MAFCQVSHFSYAHLSKRKVPLNLVIGGSLLDSLERKTLLPGLTVYQIHSVHEVFQQLSSNPA